MFEFDPNKSEANKEKHGINFKDAQRFWEDDEAVVTPASFKDEDRFRLIGKIGEDYWTAIFTVRKNNIRIISVRRSRRDEKEYYNSRRV